MSNKDESGVCPSCPYVAFLALKDRKGGDPGEWPIDLRVREFPERVVREAGG